MGQTPSLWLCLILPPPQRAAWASLVLQMQAVTPGTLLVSAQGSGVVHTLKKHFVVTGAQVLN